jgi:cell division protein FtsB
VQQIIAHDHRQNNDEAQRVLLVYGAFHLTSSERGLHENVVYSSCPPGSPFEKEVSKAMARISDAAAAVRAQHVSVSSSKINTIEATNLALNATIIEQDSKIAKLSKDKAQAEAKAKALEEKLRASGIDPADFMEQ